MRSAGKIAIAMTPDMLRVVRESVSSGDYSSPCDVIRHAARVGQHQHLEYAERLASVRVGIRRSLDDPRPDMSSGEVQNGLNVVYASAKADIDRM